MSNLAETTNMNRVMYREWFPQIVYNHHQTGPAGTVMFAPPFRDPFNFNFDPQVPIEIDLIGAAINSRMVTENKPGVTSRKGQLYSTWWNGGLRTTAYFHNMIGLLTETIGSPTPMTIPFVASKQLPDSNLYYPIEPQVWHFRQSIDYSITANRAVLDVASREKENFLFNIYRMGKNSIERGSRDSWTTTPREVLAAEAAVAGKRAAAARRPWKCVSGRRGIRTRRNTRSVREAAARPRPPRSARLHPPLRSAGLSDRDEVHQHARQERHHDRAGDRGVFRWRQELSGRLLRRQDGAGVSAARDGHVRAAGSSRRRAVSGRTADAAVRQRRLDARLPDGRHASIGCSTTSTGRSSVSPTCRSRRPERSPAGRPDIC